MFNFKSESRSFAKSNRCLIPASAFFEFTGNKSPKSKWRFTLHDSSILAIAGLWREDVKSGDAFTMLTTAPGPDIARFHDRQVVVLPVQDWASWLYLDKPEDELLKPLAASLSAIGSRCLMRTWYRFRNFCGFVLSTLVVPRLTAEGLDFVFMLVSLISF